MNLSKPKIIIWGYPLYSHTHSYVHYGWHKAFSYLGFETHWFNDNDYPKDFNFTNCLFVTEGYADNQIPIDKSSTYFVHCCRNPEKYLAAGSRLIDIRFNVKGTKDFTYEYLMDKDSYQRLDQCSYYQQNAGDSALRKKYQKGISGYEAVYTCWATDLLPHEIHFEDRFFSREQKIYYVGSIWSANYNEISRFKQACDESNIEFISRDPWKNFATVNDTIEMIKKSYIAPDIRGSGVTCDESTEEECNHLSIGYIPCRTFKNISYGQLGSTNSSAVNELFKGRIIFDQDPYHLFYKTVNQSKDYNLIQEQMEFVKENHTFVNRINSLLEIYHNK